MSYSPNNINIFIAAYSGAISGMGASNRNPTDDDPLSYEDLANTAGTFAQAYDTLWGDRSTSDLDVTTTHEICESAWENRSPNELKTGYASKLAGALIAIVEAGGNYFLDNDIPQNDTPGDGNNYAAEPLWFIDEQNVTGNASNFNNGTTPLTPLLTYTELTRRTEGLTIVPPLAGPVRPWTVIFLSKSTTANPANLRCIFGPNVLPQHKGMGTTVLSSGTFTGVTSAASLDLMRSTNTLPTVTDTARVTPWEEMSIIRITAPPARAGFQAVIAKNIAAPPAAQCTTFPWQLPSAYPVQGITEILAPVAGDTYEVLEFTDVMLGDAWDVKGTGNSQVFPFPNVGWTDIKIIQLPKVGPLTGSGTTSSTGMMFVSCTIDPLVFVLNGSWTLQSTVCRNGIAFVGGAGLNTVLGGGAFNKGDAFTFGFPGGGITNLGGGLLFVDNDAVCYGGNGWHNGAGTTGYFGNVAAFNCQDNGIDLHCSGTINLFGPKGGHKLWGSSNVGQGMQIHLGGTVFWGTPAPNNPITPFNDPYVPSIGGTVGDLAIGYGGVFGAGPPLTTIDPGSASFAYLANGPAGIAKTWAMLNTVIGSGGFGGNAMNPQGGGGIFKLPFNNF